MLRGEEKKAATVAGKALPRNPANQGRPVRSLGGEERGRQAGAARSGCILAHRPRAAGGGDFPRPRVVGARGATPGCIRGISSVRAFFAPPIHFVGKEARRGQGGKTAFARRLFPIAIVQFERGPCFQAREEVPAAAVRSRQAFGWPAANAAHAGVRWNGDSATLLRGESERP